MWTATGSTGWLNGTIGFSELNWIGATPMSDSEELKPPCDCIEQNSSGAWYMYDCQCTNSGDLIEASSWCDEMNEKAKHNPHPSVSKEPCGELVEKIDSKLPGCRDCPHVIGDIAERDCCFPDCQEISYEDAIKLLYELRASLSALQSSRGVEESWIDELGYYVQYAFDHCDELMEKFYPSIMQDFEFDEFYMSKSLCRLQVTPVCTAASMSLVIPTPDFIDWVQTMEDSHDAAS